MKIFTSIIILGLLSSQAFAEKIFVISDLFEKNLNKCSFLLKDKSNLQTLSLKPDQVELSDQDNEIFVSAGRYKNALSSKEATCLARRVGAYLGEMCTNKTFRDAVKQVRIKYNLNTNFDKGLESMEITFQILPGKDAPEVLSQPILAYDPNDLDNCKGTSSEEVKEELAKIEKRFGTPMGPNNTYIGPGEPKKDAPTKASGTDDGGPKAPAKEPAAK